MICSRYVFFVSYVSLVLLQFLGSRSALPLCANSEAPFIPRSRLNFCSGYEGKTCCNYGKEQQLQLQFDSMNVTDQSCASIVKAIICARCDPFSAELYRVSSAPRDLPVLCNSTVSPNSTQSNQATVNFCSVVWNACRNLSIWNSPFAASLQGQAGALTNSNSTKLSDIWDSETDFCGALGGASADGLPCFSGSPVVLNVTDVASPPSGLCLEKIGNGSFLDMAAHPDGSNRALFANQAGRIWLATIPEIGSGGVLELDEARPFLDLTDEVHFDNEFGLLGIAFHPRFIENGRFFVSYNCDKEKSPDCVGRCACNTDVGCDPSTLTPVNGASPCRYHSVISEFTVNGTASHPSMATRGNPMEVRRIFTMGLPFTTHHGGQIIFGPDDGYLYFMMGDGGATGDAYNFALNKKSLLGKIMRFDVDNLPSETEAAQLNLWGNYSIPKDNPYREYPDTQKEIWSLGFRNPWRCSFDSERNSYFMCGDVGQDVYEEVDLITKKGNYGWRAYEGHYPNTPTQSLGPNINVDAIRLIFPVMGYDHSEVSSYERSASITGGYVYRSMTDPCMYGRYLYADLYGSAMWAGTESPSNSGNFTSIRIPFNCAQDSPLNCSFAPNQSFPSLSYIFSFGQDNNKDVYLLANSGVYRVVHSSRCNFTCSREGQSTEPASPGHNAAQPPPPANPAGYMCRRPLLLVSAMGLLLTILV